MTTYWICNICKIKINFKETATEKDFLLEHYLHQQTFKHKIKQLVLWSLNPLRNTKSHFISED